MWAPLSVTIFITQVHILRNGIDILTSNPLNYKMDYSRKFTRMKQLIQDGLFYILRGYR